MSAVIFGMICLVGIGLISGIGWLGDRYRIPAYGVGAVALLMVVLGGFLALQAIWHLLIEATIGPARYLAFLLVLIGIGGLLALVAG